MNSHFIPESNSETGGKLRDSKHLTDDSIPDSYKQTNDTKSKGLAPKNNLWDGWKMQNVFNHSDLFSI